MKSVMNFFKSKSRMAIVIGIICIVILCGGLLTYALSKQNSFIIGNYSLKVLSDWKVNSIKAPNNTIGELIFEKNHNPIGGVEIISYYPDQPLFTPNHSEVKSKKDVNRLITKAVLVNLNLTQPAASGDSSVKNENHLYLIFEDEKVAYDIYADTKFVSESELIKIGKSFKRENKNTKECNAAVLLKYKTPYVGNNSKVVNIINNLPFANFRKEVSLETNSKPYGITVKYDFSTASLSKETIQASFRNNAIIMFSLIDNVDVINFNLCDGKDKNYQYTRSQLQNGYSQDIRQYAKDVKTFDTLLNSFSLNLFAYPEKYAMTMSSAPGIRISSQYNGTADKAEYSTTLGKLWSWDSITGKVSEYGQKAQLPMDSYVYWSALSNGQFKDTNQNSIKISIFNKNVLVAEKQVMIRFDGKMYFTVDTSTGVAISDPPQNTIKHLSEIDFSSINKIGIVSVISDKTQKRYIEKEEKISIAENDLKVFRNLISNAKVNEYMELDRLPGEYKINLYFTEGKKLTAYYWVASKENNFSIDGVIGEITLDSTIMNELIVKVTAESIRTPNTDPYSKN